MVYLLTARKSKKGLCLVVHVPKAAGTSFRWSLEKYFGEAQVVRDYGPHSEGTSEVVRDCLYGGEASKGPEVLVDRIRRSQARILIGHFPLKKYAEFFAPEDIITFVRNPLIRLCSEYLHRTNNQSFEGTISEFMHRPGSQSLQTRFLTGLSADSFIGVTEKYKESLRRINTANDWKLSSGKKNVGRKGGGKAFAENLSENELDIFYRLNQEDLQLYEEITQRFESLDTSRTGAGSLINWLKGL